MRYIYTGEVPPLTAMPLWDIHVDGEDRDLRKQTYLTYEFLDSRALVYKNSADKVKSRYN